METVSLFDFQFSEWFWVLSLILSCSQAIKPTVLIGSSGVGRTFTKEIIEAVASFNEVLYHVHLLSLLRLAKHFHLRSLFKSIFLLEEIDIAVDK